MAYNRSVWARHMEAASKYLNDAAGHVDPVQSLQCLALARSSATSAERAASTPTEQSVTSYLLSSIRALDLLPEKKIGE